jgi:integrase
LGVLFVVKPRRIKKRKLLQPPLFDIDGLKSTSLARYSLTEHRLSQVAGLAALVSAHKGREQLVAWVFNPMSLQTKLKRTVRHQRPSAKWVGKIISRIGAKAGVIVQPAKGKGKPKFASAHDLRRSCAERLVEAGVPEREVSRVLRHSDVATTRRFYAPGTVQKSAGILEPATPGSEGRLDNYAL